MVAIVYEMEIVGDGTYTISVEEVNAERAAAEMLKARKELLAGLKKEDK